VIYNSKRHLIKNTMDEGNNIYTLTYFDLYGRAEAIRMLLTHAKIPFEDKRVTGQVWQDLKASGKCPNGQLPILEGKSLNGLVMSQSIAILRFLGVKHGYYNSMDPVAAYKADSVIDNVYDCYKGDAIYCIFKPDAPTEEHIHGIVEVMTKASGLLEKDLGTEKYFGGEKPSIADFCVYAIMMSIAYNTKGKEIKAPVYAAAKATINKFPNLTNWIEKTMTPQFKDYLASRRNGSL